LSVVTVIDGKRGENEQDKWGDKGSLPKQA
jgi:hypothetical protein